MRYDSQMWESGKIGLLADYRSLPESYMARAIGNSTCTISRCMSILLQQERALLNNPHLLSRIDDTPGSLVVDLASPE